jgi:hypothetical protein
MHVGGDKQLASWSWACCKLNKAQSSKVWSADGSASAIGKSPFLHKRIFDDVSQQLTFSCDGDEVRALQEGREACPGAAA